MRKPRIDGLSVALAAFGLLALAPPATAQAVRPTELITPGTLEALRSLTESRSGFRSWSYEPPPDDSTPAPFAVQLVPALGLRQTINVYGFPPPDDSAPPSFLIQVFDASEANRLFRQIADPTGGTFCPELRRALRRGRGADHESGVLTDVERLP